MRILFLATCFPRPSDALAGIWAIEQAKALAQIAELRVVSCTSYVPKLFRVLPRAKAWVGIPTTHRWDNVVTHYPKSLLYQVAPLKRWAYENPAFQMNIAWRSVRARLLSIVKNFSPDLIYAHETAVNGYFAERLHRLTGLPYVITDHDFEVITDCEKFPKRREFFNRVVRSCFCNTAVSCRMEKDLKRLFPSARTIVVPNGINLPPPEMLSQPRPPELLGKKVILSVGMFAERKGLLVLVDAFAKVAPAFPNAVLRIVGKGNLRPQIEARIASCGLAGRVQLLGALPHREVIQQMVWSDLFALVGWNEPFGVVFAEAMATGVPIVACRDGGIADHVQDGVHGRLVEPHSVSAAAEAFDELLGNLPLCRNMGKNARLLVETKLTWDANCRRLLEIFQSALPQVTVHA